MSARSAHVSLRLTPEQRSRLDAERGDKSLSEHILERLFGPETVEAEGARAAGWARRRAEWPVACPTCPATIGNPCKGGRLNASGWHPARWQALPEGQREATAEAIEARRERLGGGVR